MSEGPAFDRPVLVVEDNAATQDLLLQFLASGSLNGTGVDSAQAAIEAIDEREPWLILCDWDLGEHLTGTQVVAHAQQNIPDAHVILMTGRSIEQLMQETAHLDVAAYLRKPFSLRDLSDALDGLTQPSL